MGNESNNTINNNIEITRVPYNPQNTNIQVYTSTIEYDNPIEANVYSRTIEYENPIEANEFIKEQMSKKQFLMDHCSITNPMEAETLPALSLLDKLAKVRKDEEEISKKEFL